MLPGPQLCVKKVREFLFSSQAILGGEIQSYRKTITMHVKGKEVHKPSHNRVAKICDCSVFKMKFRRPDPIVGGILNIIVWLISENPVIVQR